MGRLDLGAEHGDRLGLPTGNAATIDAHGRREHHEFALGDVRRLWIPGPAGRLEAALRVANPARATAVIAHPHPLHGGSLNNPVIFHTDRELNRVGLTTLRFNFRGAGQSDGEHDEGRGEVEDVAAATVWLRGIGGGVPLILVGYSFGSWCGLRHAVEQPAVAALIAIGLPLGKYPFPEIERFGRPLAVIQGERDELGAPAEVDRLLERARPRGQLHVIEGATHLFPGQAHEVGQRAAEVVVSLLDVV